MARKQTRTPLLENEAEELENEAEERGVLAEHPARAAEPWEVVAEVVSRQGRAELAANGTRPLKHDGASRALAQETARADRNLGEPYMSLRGDPSHARGKVAPHVERRGPSAGHHDHARRSQTVACCEASSPALRWAADQAQHRHPDEQRDAADNLDSGCPKNLEFQRRGRNPAQPDSH